MAEFHASMGRIYAGQRNYDYGPANRSNVSLLSPYLRTRLLTEEEVIRAVLQRFSLSSAEKFVQEVCWRTYWKGWLEHNPQIWSDYCVERASAYRSLEKDGALASEVATATNGQTGIAVFDAWMKELEDTGYLHNHARMWVSSIWIFTLGLPWVLGADHFLQHLIDADPASNTLSWRWTAGLQTRGKTYLARAANIEKYAEDRFRRELGGGWQSGLDRLAPTAPPLAGYVPPAPRPLRPNTALPDAPFGLVLTEDDLHPLSLLPTAARPIGIAGFALPQYRSPKGVGAPAQAFAENAVSYATSSAASVFGCDQTKIDVSASLSEQLIAFASDIGVSKLIIAQTPIGWSRQEVDTITERLAQNQISLIELRRDWDAAFWPHATKGFFKLKKAIPRVLTDLGLTA